IRLAVALFHFSVLLVYIASLVSWVFVSNNENIISQRIDKKTIQYENIIHAYRLSIPILGIAISMWQPMYSYFVYLVMIIGTNLLRRSYPNTYSSCSS
ncbi:MAG: hypothetical protein KAH01_01775, partial [Caldisericia bacterium]|nr:hypothetical protein [Caldisericia bacterium]